MIKKSLLLMLLLAILAPWAAQAQETLTVYDGTTGTLTSNANVPMYGNYFDAYTKSEFVIPADQLSDMDGGTITSLKFYIQSVGTYGSGWSSNQQVFLKEVSSTSLSAFSGTDDATIVWEGSFTVPSSSDTEFEITFTTPYEYQGGNLLVGIYNITKGGYRNVAWYGQTVNGASGNGNNSSSLSGVPFSQKNFIPKTTFTYEAAASDCPKPNNLVASNVTAHTADLSWESDGIEFILQYKKASQSSWNEESLYPEELDFPYMLTNLAAETEYQARVAAFHETCPTDPETGDHVHSDWREISFTTGIACPAPTNLAVTAESITAREATVTWEGTSNSYVVMIGEENLAVSADFETGDLSQAGFTSTSSYPWTVVANTHSGAYCAKSGNGGHNSSASYLYLEVNLTADMTLTFSAKVSSESGYDKAYFDIDGDTKINGISGNGNWIDYSYPLTVGTHILSWRYEKDSSTAGNDDCFYVDDIVVSAGVDSWTDYNTDAKTYTFTNLTANRHYQVKVTGNCGDEGYSQESAPVGFTTLESCVTPTDLAASDVTANEATISWTSAAEAWQICVNDDEENLIGTTETTYTLTGLDAQTTYTVKVRTNCGDEDYSDWKTIVFTTACGAVTTFPWSDDFESYQASSQGITFNNPCWVNEHISGSGSYFFEVYSGNYSGGNSTTTLRLHDMSNGTLTKLMLPEMTLPGDNYLFSIDVFRNAAGNSYTSEGVRVFVSADGEIEGATELAFLYRNFTQTDGNLIPAESAEGWYTYELPIPMSGTCYIILRGESQYGSATYMDNFAVMQAPACVKPTGLAVSNITGHEATLSWTSAADAWQICVNDDEENLIDVTETTYNFTGLTPETAYTVKVRANCGDEGYSDWTDNVSFTTDVACPAPTGLVVSNITGHEATLNWQGTSNEYQVRYRTAGYMVGIEEGFSSNPAGWSFKTGALNADGTATLSGNTSWNRNTSNGVFDTHIYMNMYNTKNYWLITPSMEIQDGYALSFDMAYTAYSGTQVAPTPNSPSHRFAVLISTDDMQHWTILREWNNSGSEYVLDQVSPAGENSGNIDLSAYVGQTAYIAFFGHSEFTNYDNNFHFDNVAIGIPVPAGEMQYATNITEETVTLQGLLAETEYEAWLQGDCGSEGLSTEVGPITFTTDIACPAPTGLAATEISGYTAKLNWTGYSESYIVYYRAAIYKAANLAGEWETVSVDEPPCILAGLTPETTYEAKVQGDCGDDGLSLETYITFTTDIACPAPTVLAFSNITGHEATITWTSAAEAWQICVNDDEENLIDVTENTYTLTGLTPETAYTVKVRANCGDDGYSDWTNNVSFTTDVACPAPTNLAASNLTQNTADLTWNGDSDSYNVQYREAATTNQLLFEGFETYADEAALEAVWTVLDLGDGNNTSELGLSSSAKKTGDYGFRFSSYSGSSGGDFDQYLISPELTKAGLLEFAYKSSNGTADKFRVGYSSTTNDVTAFTWGEEMASASSWTTFSETMPENAKYFAINYTAVYEYRLYIDDITIYEITPAGEWQSATSTTTSTQLTGLTAGTEYEVQVQGVCDTVSGNWSEAITFTTMDVIIWNNPDDWTVPETYADVTIPANTLVIIPDGCIARPSNITFEENGSLTIEPGGQLVHDQDSVVATVVMDIIGYGDGLKNNYYLIASPLRDPISPMAVENMTNNVFDLYKFDQSNHNDENEYLEWVNYHGLINGSYPLVNTEGYLYANSDDVMPRFTGEVRRSDENVEVGLIYDDDIRVRFNGWNLVGNPFVCNAFVLTEQGQTVDFYEIVGDSLSLTTNNEIAPCQGIFVQAESDVQTVTFSRTAPAKRSGVLNMNLTQGRAKVDMARIRFGEGRNLGRLSFNDNSTKLYIPMDGKDYAVVYSEGMGEMPVSFKAEYNGTYTLGFSNSEVSFSYLHLIDNMTGADVDLLQTPNYSFEASTTDYASRFKLVFCTGNAMEDNFAFFSNGSFVINNEGEATLQVIDVTGRIVKSESINGSASVNVNAAAGVYMLRLINGNDVKVQKIVVK